MPTKGGWDLTWRYRVNMVFSRVAVRMLGGGASVVGLCLLAGFDIKGKGKVIPLQARCGPEGG